MKLYILFIIVYHVFFTSSVMLSAQEELQIPEFINEITDSKLPINMLAMKCRLGEPEN